MPRLIAQIDDELHRAVRKNTLQAMIGIEAFVKPKQLDELIERRSRDMRSEYHEWKPRMTRSTERHENYWQSGVQLSRFETKPYPGSAAPFPLARVDARAHGVEHSLMPPLTRKKLRVDGYAPASASKVSPTCRLPQSGVIES
jgi:hypothetical protein